MGIVCNTKDFIVSRCISGKVVVVQRLKTRFVRGLVRKTVITVLVILVIEGLEKRGVFVHIGKAADALIAAITDHLLFGTGSTVADVVESGE